MSRMILSVVAVGLLATAAIGTVAKAATLSAGARSAVEAAIDDEYRAEAFYAAVIAEFGQVRPFSNIIRAEQMHASELGAIMAKYGLKKPANPYLADPAITASVPETLAEACKMGVDAEVLNRNLYDKRLMPAVQDYPDIQIVFSALRDASEFKHLQAFEHCGGQGQGQGRGMRMGQGKWIGQGLNVPKP
ncbi:MULTISPECIES: ferritin-like domain-containing protein [Alphaproteobacteria]|uniref:Uncharacterized protein n=2 Tax=Alphaproteobacteria TaxID=28211 RepID=A0A512HDP3_9HYPH|nr:MULTISPECIES: DUF2202 domain-containing protein [Alphaproteobacteria]GEO83572.1 hypothetical protein RNA01_05040 [Ciceribacter naphthalenivorans]GLR24276.1 hypothetical protein GCM10007920_40700 [Ciceribacter naphthalenivorans]GLT07132.1 hypothetical protein GCM10007926_40700 [Sphingomonas psychrolutea]